MTTDEARALAAAFDSAGIQQSNQARDPLALGYHLNTPEADSTRVEIRFWPSLPHGASECACYG